MIQLPDEEDFYPHDQILVRKGDGPSQWEVLHLSTFQEAAKRQYGLTGLFYHVCEWRRIA